MINLLIDADQYRRKTDLGNEDIGNENMIYEARHNKQITNKIKKAKCDTNPPLEAQQRQNGSN
ncbi:MAG TPA: hypothetical protein VIS54_01285 [Psychromonas sp.]